MEDRKMVHKTLFWVGIPKLIKDQIHITCTNGSVWIGSRKTFEEEWEVLDGNV